jgi:anti-sigma factor RsiW
MNNGLNCNQLVELVTDYFDDALTDEQRRAFQDHLAACEGCANHVAQMRTTISLTGSLRVDDIEPAALDSLLAAFRNFRRDPTV